MVWDVLTANECVLVLHSPTVPWLYVFPPRVTVIAPVSRVKVLQGRARAFIWTWSIT